MTAIGDKIQTTVNVVIAEVRVEKISRTAVTLNVGGGRQTLFEGDVLTITQPRRATAVVESIEKSSG